MKRTPELFEKIEAYLNNQMELNDKEAFVKSLQNDESLRLEIERHKLLQEAIQDQGKVNFHNKLTKIGKELRQEELSDNEILNQVNTKQVLKIAAVVILVISSVFAIFQLIPSKSNEDIYQAYYSPFPLESSLRGEQEPKSVINIKQGYKDGDYLNVIPELENLIKESPDQHVLKLYLATCYFEKNRHDKADALLNSIPTDSKLWQKALWYQSLAKLKLGEKDQAKVLLDQLINGKGSFKEKAIKLRKELD